MSDVAAQRPPDAGLDPQGITTRSGSNFLAGFLCLDEARREAMTAIYAFCRVVDDAVDESPDGAKLVDGTGGICRWGGALYSQPLLLSQRLATSGGYSHPSAPGSVSGGQPKKNL